MYYLKPHLISLKKSDFFLPIPKGQLKDTEDNIFSVQSWRDCSDGSIMDMSGTVKLLFLDGICYGVTYQFSLDLADHLLWFALPKSSLYSRYVSNSEALLTSNHVLCENQIYKLCLQSLVWSTYRFQNHHYCVLPPFMYLVCSIVLRWTAVLTFLGS